jgi:hypothetical protein
VGDAGRGQHLRGEGRREPQAHHGLNEPPAGKVSALDLFDELAKHVLVHVASGAAGVGAPVLRDGC